jgi:EamA domain-containing membrane protein RarD
MMAIVFTAIALLLLLHVRVRVAYRAMVGALKYIHARNLYLNDIERWDEMFDYANLPSYNSMIFDLTVWSWQGVIRKLDLPEV